MGILLLLYLFLSSNIDDNQSIIYWDENPIITWNDFSIVDAIEDEEDAIVFLGMPYSLKPDESGRILIFSVRASIDKTKSKVRSGEQNENLLSHEQGHYDIQEIYSRMFRQEVSNSHFVLKNISEEINILSDKYNVLLSKEHEKYDNETNHSKIIEKQVEWSKLIKNRLDSLQNYSKIFVEIKNLK